MTNGVPSPHLKGVISVPTTFEFRLSEERLSSYRQCSEEAGLSLSAWLRGLADREERARWEVRNRLLLEREERARMQAEIRGAGLR